VNEMTTVSIVAMLGWLVLVVIGFASFRLSWGKTAQLAFSWLAIFVGLFLLANLLGLEL